MRRRVPLMSSGPLSGRLFPLSMFLYLEKKPKKNPPRRQDYSSRFAEHKKEGILLSDIAKNRITS